MDAFGTFTYVSSYLQTKTFAQKRDCATSSKLQIGRHQSRPFQKILTNFYALKNNYPKTAYTFLKDRSIFSYFLRLNCYNFRTALTKSNKPHFLKIAL